MQGIPDGEYSYVAKSPTPPKPGEKVICQYCAQTILEDINPDGKPSAWPADKARRFRVCSTCRDMVVGHGQLLDVNTPGLSTSRKLT